jgi:hypothetical protein
MTVHDAAVQHDSLAQAPVPVQSIEQLLPPHLTLFLHEPVPVHFRSHVVA